jgi:hypothetical protein
MQVTQEQLPVPVGNCTIYPTQSDHWASLRCARSPPGQAFYDVYSPLPCGSPFGPAKRWSKSFQTILSVRQHAALLQASSRPFLADWPLPFASSYCSIGPYRPTNTDPPTGDLHPISSCPCRAYTRRSSGPECRVDSCAIFRVMASRHSGC